jgi:hypothetical protein
VGIGAASAVERENDVGAVLDAVLEWWPHPWEPPPPHWRSTPWATSWSLGVTVQRNTFTRHITGPPMPGVSSTSTVWEPHLDVAAGYCTSEGSELPRIRVGVGMYIGTATLTDASARRLSTRGTGAALRLGIGSISFPQAPLGIAFDIGLEGGWIGSSAVGSVQVLVGPSLHLGAH